MTISILAVSADGGFLIDQYSTLRGHIAIDSRILAIAGEGDRLSVLARQNGYPCAGRHRSRFGIEGRSAHHHGAARHRVSSGDHLAALLIGRILHKRLDGEGTLLVDRYLLRIGESRLDIAQRALRIAAIGGVVKQESILIRDVDGAAILNTLVGCGVKHRSGHRGSLGLGCELITAELHFRTVAEDVIRLTGLDIELKGADKLFAERIVSTDCHLGRCIAIGQELQVGSGQGSAIRQFCHIGGLASIDVDPAKHMTVFGRCKHVVGSLFRQVALIRIIARGTTSAAKFCILRVVSADDTDHPGLDFRLARLIIHDHHILSKEISAISFGSRELDGIVFCTMVIAQYQLCVSGRQRVPIGIGTRLGEKRGLGRLCLNTDCHEHRRHQRKEFPHTHLFLG